MRRSSLQVLRNLLTSLFGSAAANAAAADAMAVGQTNADGSRIRQHQVVRIANFPPHEIKRLDDGQWLIYNENVTFVSCQRGELPTYDERGFLTAAPVDIQSVAGVEAAAVD